MNLLASRNGRNLITFALYFAEGVPIGFIWWAMPTILRQSGATLGMIGSFTAILTLPWVFKFLWAPLVDIFRRPGFGFTGWISLAQTLMCLSLLPLLFIPLSGNFTIWAVCLFMHSMFAATQDVAVDALVINLVAKNEKGLLNGYMQAGMLVGRSIFGGVALILVQQLGLSVIILLMMLSIAGTLGLLVFVKEPSFVFSEKLPFPKFKKSLIDTFKNKNTWFVIAFALTAAAAFEAAGAFAGPLFTDKQISEKSIGFFFAVPVVIAMLLGGLAGGFLSDRTDRKKAVGHYLTGFVIMVFTIACIDWIFPAAPNLVWMGLYSTMYFFTGMFTASSYALFMDVTNPKLGATQFSSFMAATNGCEAWVVYSSGIIAAGSDLKVAFLIMCGISIVSLLFLKKIVA